MKIRQGLIMLTLSTLVVALNLSAQEDYKIYTPVQAEEYFMKISMVEKQVVIELISPDTTEKIVFGRNDVKRMTNEIIIKGRPFLSKEGFLVAGKIFPLDSVDRVTVEKDEDGETRILFTKKSGAATKALHAHKQNEISLLDSIYVGNDQFVRGSVVTFWGNALVDGEVNEDVVSIFGNATIGDDAVVRGNVVAVNGSVSISKKATIYGSVQSSGSKNKFRFDRWRKWYRKDRYFSPILKFYYNRVDGAAPYFGVAYTDEDSLLPDIEVFAGYGFESSRWRYNIGASQTLHRSRPITIGGSVYRRLASNDDWLISESENTIFALLAKEDYKDYFEAEGGYGFGRFRPFERLCLEVGVLAEKYKWLNGHINLWSLFGGNKKFPDNFSSVEGPYRAIGMAEIDDRDITSFNFKVDLPDQETDDPLTISQWDGSANLEWAPAEWNSDFSFTRYIVSLTRRQRINEQSGFVFRGVYGGSGGYLPLERRFFIGGLGTLYGYLQKEYMGTEFWMSNIEYGFKFPNADMIGWVFYDFGAIGNSSVNLGNAEIKHSLGVGLSFGQDIRLNIAKRLDRSDTSPRIYFRFAHIFD